MHERLSITLSLILFFYVLNAHATGKLLKEDDLRDRNIDIQSLKGRTVELFMHVEGFRGNIIILRDVYGENIRAIATVPDALSLTYSDYRETEQKLISGYDFNCYGEKNPSATLKEIIEKLISQSRNMPLSVIVRLEIQEVKRKNHDLNTNLDYITIRAKLIHMIL
jgi:hypothetical protein